MAQESYQLAYKIGDEEHVCVLDVPEVTMGRGPECTLQLPDYSISRQHAKVVEKDGEYIAVDLGSRNGTRVNGARITQVNLSDGDELVLGKFPLHFRKTLREKVVLREGKPLEEGGGTIIRHVSDIQDILAEAPPSAPSAAVAAPSGDIAKIEKSNRILLALSKIARNLMTTKSLDDLLPTIMDLIFEHIPAERGYLLLREEDGGDLVPKVVKYREDRHRSDDDGNLTISKTIVQKVLEEKVALYSLDAGKEFAGAQSIAAAKIRSFMSAPLWNQDRVIGVVHLDSTNLQQFTPSELDMLSAIANYAAVGIEQSRLNRRIQETQKAKAKLERYHSANVIKRILSTTGETSSANISLEVQEMDCSILFADVVGFTSMSEKMEPRQVALLLNDFFSRMTDIIFEYEGTLDKYIGDEIMAVFGAPIPYADHALRAIRAALAMRRAQTEANESRVSEARLSIRTGVNSGRVVAGDIGSLKRMDYTVLGSPVNVASRLVKATKEADKIIIGKSTYDLIKDHFKTASLGTAQLKGLTEEMEIYEVLD
ncbi:MAG TPA: adenylate/guanylate cyclase domain-containing protein [Candidatus Saccharimonadales bacterium]|nr:adenylate/guanylate cyclase domain-containing protein [Candidatus Saccharimonadales bacterium]